MAYSYCLPVYCRPKEDAERFKFFKRTSAKAGIFSVEYVSIIKTYRFLHWNPRTPVSMPESECYSIWIFLTTRPFTIEQRVFAKTLMKNESLDCPKRLGNTFKFPNPGVILHCPLSTQTTREFDSQNPCKTIITRFDEANESPGHKTRRLP